MRYIGIRHRVKKTADLEPRPTQVGIREAETTKSYNLESEQDELDFVKGVFPTAYRPIVDGEDLSGFREHQIKWRKLKDEEKPEQFAPNRLVKEGKKTYYVATKVPVEFDGLLEGDRVAMMLGGSGDYFAFALTKRGEKVGARVYRIPPFVFDTKRTTRDKDQDCHRLAELLMQEPQLFYGVNTPDRDLIGMRIKLDERIDAMNDRIACEQRLRQRFIGEIFCSEDGEFPEGAIEKEFAALQTNDTILQTLLREEAGCERKLIKAVEGLEVYQKVFAPIDGCGPFLASRIIGDVQDVRRFKKVSRFRAYCGTHVQTWWKCANEACSKLVALKREGTPKPETCPKCNGKSFVEYRRFPRRRNDSVANWKENSRQAFFLLASDQAKKRPNTFYGWVLRAAKLFFRSKHERATVEGKLVYSDGHIHKMGIWRTATINTDQIYLAWWKLHGGAPDEETARRYVVNRMKRLEGLLPPNYKGAEGQTDEGEPPVTVNE